MKAKRLRAEAASSIIYNIHKHEAQDLETKLGLYVNERRRKDSAWILREGNRY
jgi:hypothetical protein